MNISNPPGGNQPPNYTADIGNAQEVTMTTSGGLGESETAGLIMNIVPKQGGNTLSGLFCVVRLLEGDAVEQLHRRAEGAGRQRSRTPTYHVYDFNAAVGGPIVKDKLWYYMSVRAAGSRRNILNVYYNQNAGNADAVLLRAGLQPAGVLRSAVGELHAAHHVAGDAEATSSPSRGTSSRCAARARARPSSAARPSRPTAPDADGHGEFSPQRVQTARWTSPVTNRLLLEAGMGNTYYQWGVRELDPNPGARPGAQSRTTRP